MSESLIGTTLSGRYKVEALLGSGGMGSVYLVQHTQLRRRFALKLLHAETSKVPEMVARFEREAMAAANVDHPNIAFATDFGRTDTGEFFLVLEYLEGQRLRDALAGGPLEVRRAVHIVRQVASALERSHELGVVHRDLKPENIMLVPRQGDPDFVKVLDFGLAKVATQTPLAGGDEPAQALTKHGTLFGTPKYMAPEQCVSGAIDGRTDLYALGVSLYELLTGINPFGAKDVVGIIRNQIAMPTPPMKDVAPGVRVPAALEAIAKRLTEKIPDNRYASAKELLAALDQVAADLGAPAASSPGPTPAATTRPTAAGQTVASAEILSVGGTLADGGAFGPASPAASEPPAAPSASSQEKSPAPPALRASTDGRSVAGTLYSRLPLPLQRPPVLLAAAALVLVGLVLLLRPKSPPSEGAAPRSGTTRSGVRKPQAPVRRAPQQELERAINDGLPAALALVEKYPQDGHVQRAVAHLYMAQNSGDGNGVEALRWFARVVAGDSDLVADGAIAQAAAMADKTPDSLAAAFALLEGEFGSRGIDVLYALAYRPAPARLKARARKSLEQPQVRARASTAAAVAIDLHVAARCEDKRALLPRAGRSGDQRALQVLRALQQTHNCGPYGLIDCYPCLRGDTSLQSAITAIESRTGKD
jgi:serine/threonine-protein kinase